MTTYVCNIEIEPHTYCIKQFECANEEEAHDLATVWCLEQDGRYPRDIDVFTREEWVRYEHGRLINEGGDHD